MCRFHEDVKQEFVPVCSEGNISVETEKEVLGILPFLAAASSVLVIAELYRLQKPLQYKDNANFIEFSMLKSEGNFLTTNYDPKQCYVCEDQKINLYPSATQVSKYWQFSDEEVLYP